MFTKHSRLNQAEDFKNLFSTGKKHANRYFAFFTKPNNLQCSRLGLVVAKKAVSKAVQRNQIKRIIRESFRINKKAIIVSLDVVVVVYHNTIKLSKIQLREKMDEEWLRLISFYKKS